MHQLKGIYGINYSPDTLSNKQSGYNHIRICYFDLLNDHTDFLFTCDRNNISVEIVIPNSLLDSRNVNLIKKLIYSIRKYNCINIYTIGNNYSGSIDNIIFYIELIYTLDKTKYIMCSINYINSFEYIKKIYQRIPDYIKLKYITGININSNKRIDQILNEYYNDQLLKNSYIIILNKYNLLFNNNEYLQRYINYLGC